jgi:hypothetical protein
LVDSGVRIFGPDASVAQDLEPEHIAVGLLGFRAWVTLQENNAVALLDLLRYPPRVAAIFPLGDKDHAAPGNGLDVSDLDGPGMIGPHPGLSGMYLPDGIEAGFVGGRTYLFTANEGDARDYPPCFTEETRVASLSLDPAAFPPEEAAALARLRVTTTRGHAGGAYRELFSFGGRSFAVWDSSDLRLVHDGGSAIEEILAGRFPGYFPESRSDDKGPEPEDLAFGRVGGRPYLFVGLERANGIMAFDVGEPANPSFAGFIANAPDTAFPAGESPERLNFVPALANPHGGALLLATNETSGTTRAFALDAEP